MSKCHDTNLRMFHSHMRESKIPDAIHSSSYGMPCREKCYVGRLAAQLIIMNTRDLYIFKILQ